MTAEQTPNPNLITEVPEFPQPQVVEPGVPAESVLAGPRRTGIEVSDNGRVTMHAVSGDGMKFSRVIDGGRVSAAEFHRQAGVAQPYEMEAGNQVPEKTGRMRKVARSVGRGIVNAARISRP